jgi:hypothetical protein
LSASYCRVSTSVIPPAAIRHLQQTSSLYSFSHRA